MEEKSYGWLVILLIFIVVLGGIGGTGLFGNNRSVVDGCSKVSNCEVEKQTIINTATTQNLINTQAEATRAQASAIYQAQQSERLFDLKLENNALKAEAIATANYNNLSREYERCCCELNRRLDSIECNMLPRPRLYGVAATCAGDIIPPTGFAK